MRHNLLSEPLIETDRGFMSLPGLLAAMARREVSVFPALRPHQRPAWHMFLVQLAVLALDANGRDAVPDDEGDWRQALRSLTKAYPNDEPWCLVVPGRNCPAFMQPPDPGGLKWTEVATPDALDMLITARNHDVKQEIARDAAPQDWIFALVSLQTMEGFGGAGNYGIARMNGGSSSRVLIGLAPAGPVSAEVDPSAWWLRDVRRLRKDRSGVTGKALLWLEPWGDDALDLSSLDPQFVEVCRRIRLVGRAGRVAAERSTSKAARIAGKEAKGNTGDPWAPIHIGEGKALTLGERDWSYDLLVTLLFDRKREWSVPSLARPSAEEERAPMLLVAEAFSRGNSTTDGFRSRVVPVPKAVVAMMFGEEPVAVSEQILEDIATVERALRDGLAIVAAEGDRAKVGKAQRARSIPARDLLRREADLLFFPELWRRVEGKADADFAPLRLAFLESLAGHARRIFEDALPAIPCASVLRPRAEVRGRAALEQSIVRATRDLKQPELSHA